MTLSLDATTGRSRKGPEKGQSAAGCSFAAAQYEVRKAYPFGANRDNHKTKAVLGRLGVWV